MSAVERADLPDIRDEITAALEGYRRVFPEPYSLSPNLQLAVRALAEAERLTKWKTEALPVLTGLQELGRALGIGLGKRITSRDAVDAALDLRNERDKALAEVKRQAAVIATVMATTSHHGLARGSTHPGPAALCSPFCAAHAPAVGE